MAMCSVTLECWCSCPSGSTSKAITECTVVGIRIHCYRRPRSQWRNSNRRAPVFLRQVRLSPGLAIELVTKIKHVGSISKPIIFAPKHPALPSQPACDCEDQL
ncbi:hypothetical protein PoB_005056300 [Plakobranchus ocellatus]|uniref:Uncharacterized protein n=1 Tax=Plakobranchus ocellatus TaxID=259542 RepID=A0AAV4BZ43_9GAST|nr:hypothetical protein PoB_005056300 [Plakobranchus ocellatus]